MELAHAPLLRALIAKHGTGGEQAAHAFAGMPGILDIGPHDTGRGFRPQGHEAVVTVGKGEHFLLHHIGFLTDGTPEQIGKFQHRRAQFHKAAAAEHAARRGFHKGKGIGVRRKHVRKPLDAGYMSCHWSPSAVALHAGIFKTKPVHFGTGNGIVPVEAGQAVTVGMHD